MSPGVETIRRRRAFLALIVLGVNRRDRFDGDAPRPESSNECQRFLADLSVTTGGGGGAIAGTTCSSGSTLGALDDPLISWYDCMDGSMMSSSEIPDLARVTTRARISASSSTGFSNFSCSVQIISLRTWAKRSLKSSASSGRDAEDTSSTFNGASGALRVTSVAGRLTYSANCSKDILAAPSAAAGTFSWKSSPSITSPASRTAGSKRLKRGFRYWITAYGRSS
uniref:(northern house mosquito) hypothetical protein n=1 Tax=Culex pipiens TaxID=7175 RepID=A0A8D8B7D0_CULPI